ncbi:MAG: rRNA maturation RNase YbeY [Clostridia bacterium]|nr:rRNA maturation RNase YbeY [Clostridia bacterium]
MSKFTLYCDNEYIDPLLLSSCVYSTLKQRVKLSAEICFCSPEDIKQLNSETRGKDAVTDVLSFPSAGVLAGEIVKIKNYPFDIDPENGGVFMGSIMICVERAREQAEEYGHSLNREIYYLAVHGLLHLFGYDHENEDDKAIMREMEEIILNKIGAVRG